MPTGLAHRISQGFYKVFTVITNSPKETASLGRRLGRLLGPRTVLALRGDLGAGKTTFVQGLARGLGVKEDHVVSPTFVLVREYRGKLPLYHIDLYRLSPGREVELLGLDEYLEGEGVCAVEWAEKGEGILPAAAVRITLALRDASSREITVEGLPESVEAALVRPG
jgi:tRNA threonylcarbamoyladenosine biosynthesis protein TsaE